MVRHVVKPIRKHYHRQAPIIIRLDSGFFDQKLFRVFEELQVGYICGGKLYRDIKAYVASLGPSAWRRYQSGDPNFQQCSQFQPGKAANSSRLRLLP